MVTYLALEYVNLIMFHSYVEQTRKKVHFCRIIMLYVSVILCWKLVFLDVQASLLFQNGERCMLNFKICPRRKTDFNSTDPYSLRTTR
jgi:hypothetical protein